jgi:hypothetical protein
MADFCSATLAEILSAVDTSRHVGRFRARLMLSQNADDRSGNQL